MNLREDPNDRMFMLKSQLTEALEENAFIKSRLNAELKERHQMEAKYKELNKKFTESKKALQATGAALLQVHNQTSEMKNKRDEREIQLDEALNLNRNLNSKIAELETRLEQALLSNNSGSTTANLKRLIEDKEGLIKSMEEQQLQLQGQMSKIRRDNYRLGEENAELQEAVDAKNRKIANLVKKAATLEEELEAAHEFKRQTLSRGRTPNGSDGGRRPGGDRSSRDPAGPSGAPQAGAGPSNANGAKNDNKSALESRLNNFEGDKKYLEERMAQLELSLKQSESFIQLIHSNSQDNSPVKQSQFFPNPNNYPANGTQGIELPSLNAAPPGNEKPSMTSPRKSPGSTTRPKASAGAAILTPIPIESHEEELARVAQAQQQQYMQQQQLLQAQQAAAQAAHQQQLLQAQQAAAQAQAQQQALYQAQLQAQQQQQQLLLQQQAQQFQLQQQQQQQALAASQAKVNATNNNGELTDSLFSSSSVIEVSRVPNDVLDKPLSAPRQAVAAPVEAVAPVAAAAAVPPMVESSPASTSSRRSSKLKKGRSSKSEKGILIPSTTSSTLAAIPEPAAPAPAAVAATPAPIVAAPAPAPTPAPAPAPVVVAPAPVAEPAPVVAAPQAAPVASKPTSAAAAPVPTSASSKPTSASAASTVVAGTTDPATSGAPADARAGSARRSIRTPLSASGRRPTSSKAAASTDGSESVVYEFPPSGTIAGRYTDASVDELLKPDADVEVFKERLLELRKRVKRDIYAWTKSFVNEFQRQPNKQERKDVAGAMFKAYSGSQKLLKDLGVDIVGESTKLGRGSSVKFSGTAEE